MACLTEQQLVFNNKPSILEAPGKRPHKATPHPLGNCLLLNPPPPPPVRISLVLREEGMDIFLELHNIGFVGNSK